MFKVGDAVRLRRPEEIKGFNKYPELLKKEIREKQGKSFIIQRILTHKDWGAGTGMSYLLSDNSTYSFLEYELEAIKIDKANDEEFISIMF